MGVKNCRELARKICMTLRKMRQMRRKCPYAMKLQRQFIKLMRSIKKAQRWSDIPKPEFWDSDDDDDDEE